MNSLVDKGEVRAVVNVDARNVLVLRSKPKLLHADKAEHVSLRERTPGNTKRLNSEFNGKPRRKFMLTDRNTHRRGESSSLLLSRTITAAIYIGRFHELEAGSFSNSP